MFKISRGTIIIRCTQNKIKLYNNNNNNNNNNNKYSIYIPGQIWYGLC